MGWSITTTDSGGSGLFLVLEGIEGAGKSTQVRRLADWLEAGGIRHVVTREPGGTAVGEAIRSVVLKDPELDVPAESELFLLLAARAAFVREVVGPAMESGAVVIADRYELSTVAYQGYGRGLDLTVVRSANRLATGGLQPDLCIVLDIPVALGIDRQRAEGKEADRVEREGAPFLTRVREGYQDAVRDDPRVLSVDGTLPPDQVTEAIRALLTRRFPETFASLPAYQ